MIHIMSTGEYGSSPRGRGKRNTRTQLELTSGLIPAWAGKTRARRSSNVTWTAHPRVGGENTLSGSRLFIPPPAHPRVGGENPFDVELESGLEGSSPRGRGKRDAYELVRDGVRLIPAWAGKTASSAQAPNARAAHPRVGGENAASRSKPSTLAGSSPRGRGKLSFRTGPLRTPGLIPAWAGKTHQVLPRTHLLTAHPRVGGENRVRGHRPQD